MSKPLRQQFADTLLAVGTEDPRLAVMVGDISHGILQPYAAACPGRYFNVGILEPTMVSMGAGLSASGMIPVLHTIAPFMIERSFEQLKLDFAYHQLPGNVVTVGSAFDYSNLGSTHHCYGDFALLKTLPGTEICFAASDLEFDCLFRQAYDNKQLTVYRLAGKAHGVAFSPSDVVLGRALEVETGRDVSLVATGPMLQVALSACETLRRDGIGADVIYIHTIRPLDHRTIRRSAEKTRRVVTIEEHMRSGGLGDDVLREIYDIAGLRFHAVAIPDRFVTGYGTYEQLCASCGLTPNNVVNAVRELMD